MKKGSKEKVLSAWTNDCLQKYIAPQQLADVIGKLRRANRSIATLNGSFDLLHAGHLHMIYEASQMADILIIALNSDSSIKAYKDEKRPIIPLKYRLQMMAALGFVDYVTWFDETDPIKILAIIQPDVHVNGSEYGENCIEAETVKRYGGVLHIVDKIDGLSTTSIIDKIKSL